MRDSTTQGSTLRLYRKLRGLPFGRWVFARAVCARAPYFATIRPRFHALEPGRCEVSMRRRRAVLNHIGSVHALAMGNLCELAAGMLMEATLPPSMRWIPRRMTIEYVARAQSDVTGVAHLPCREWSASDDVQVPVSVRDDAGREVVRATITMYVSPRRPR